MTPLKADASENVGERREIDRLCGTEQTSVFFA
jgi:hypothetical protein